MIAIDKNKTEIPLSLTDKKRQVTFQENANKEKYISGNKYKTLTKGLAKNYNRA